jgi:hypothetical protein
MKKLMQLSSLFLALLLMTGIEAYAQKMPGLDKSPHDIAYFRVDQQAAIKVLYGRPQKSGRDIFGKLVPYGKIWRTGANESTEVTFYQDVVFGGETVEAGTYSLFSIPGEETWTIILNSGLDAWGAYQYDAAKDVARTEVEAQATDGTVEAFTITFQEVEGGAHMIIAWDNTKVEVPIEISGS